MWDALIGFAKLPERLLFSPSVHRRFALLWKRSVESQSEWGMTLTLDRAGKVHGRHARQGTAQDFLADIRSQHGERLAGVYHTHVYESGETGVAFSDFDIASFIICSEIPLSLVQSGEALFALVRSMQTVTIVPYDFLGGNGQFYAKLVDTMETNPRLSYQQALWLTNLRFARVFRIGLYRGQLYEPLRGVFQP